MRGAKAEEECQEGRQKMEEQRKERSVCEGQGRPLRVTVGIYIVLQHQVVAPVRHVVRLEIQTHSDKDHTHRCTDRNEHGNT